MVKYMKFFGWSQTAMIRGLVWPTSHPSHSSLKKNICFRFLVLVFGSWSLVLVRLKMGLLPGHTVHNVLFSSVWSRGAYEVHLNSDDWWLIGDENNNDLFPSMLSMKATWSYCQGWLSLLTSSTTSSWWYQHWEYGLWWWLLSWQQQQTIMLKYRDVLGSPFLKSALSI